MERKEAIEIVKSNLPDSIFTVTALREALETLIPELVSDEERDERIRKELLEHCKNQAEPYIRTGNKCLQIQSWIAWLEKQGEQKGYAKEAPASGALSFINYLDAHRYIGKMCVSNGECEDIVDAFHNGMWDKLHRYYCKYIETPDVSDYNPYEATVKSIIAMTERYANGNDLRDFYDNVKVKCKEAVDYDKTWLEKTSKQESTNELKQEFKVGDWIFSPAWGTAHIIGTGVIGVNDSDFLLEYTDGKKEYTPSEYVDSAFDKWNIKDAKEGDVLVASDETLFIFAGTKDNAAYYHYSLCKNGSQEISDGKHAWESANSCHPATKEQRDLLFKKMKEAGYGWDPDKKELEITDWSKHITSKQTYHIQIDEPSGITVESADEAGSALDTHPKFKVGDWAAADRINFRSPTKIVDISDTEYRVEDAKGNGGMPKIDYFDNRYHLWSIADAKDGDVLISACNHPFIYNGNNNSSLVGGYCGIATAGGFKISTEECHWTENINIHPATKEQQNYLFQKMREAGYMWDSYTKSVFCSINRNPND